MAPVEVSTYRVRHSPSWSFRWDNRTHIEDIMENTAVFSNQSSGNIQPEVKNSFIAPTEGHNSGDSRSDVFRKVKWQKSDKKMEASKLSKVDPRGLAGVSSWSSKNDLTKLELVQRAKWLKSDKKMEAPKSTKADSHGETFQEITGHGKCCFRFEDIGICSFNATLSIQSRPFILQGSFAINRFRFNEKSTTVTRVSIIQTEADKYDPPCPVCTHGEKCTVKLFGKLESKIKNKIPKNVVVDIDIDGND
nr:unnamed protein product [Digitaria exilis]